MKEDFLNFIWKHQYFDKAGLESHQGQRIQILDPGQLNQHAGPDFIDARIKIGSTCWVGSVEIHTDASHWFLHRHHQDQSYDQVILHVVWSNKIIAKTSNGLEVPTLVLEHRVEPSLVLRHRRLRLSTSRIPCELLGITVNQRAIGNMQDKVLIERLTRKSATVLELLKSNRSDWDQATYRMFGGNFGFKVNNHPFSRLVSMVPLAIARKVRPNLRQLEALYFGQAGLLNKVSGDGYYQQLQDEYRYLQRKFSLSQPTLKSSVWKYLRLRPANFPALRIAQFAALVHMEGYRFSEILSIKEYRHYPMRQLTPSSYWGQHYDFGKPGGNGGKLGNTSFVNLLINVVVPMLMAYARYTGSMDRQQQAIKLLKQLPAEHNQILSYWKDCGFAVSSAFDSQALIELNNQYCIHKKCLQCEIGKTLLNASSD